MELSVDMQNIVQTFGLLFILLMLVALAWGVIWYLRNHDKRVDAKKKKKFDETVSYMKAAILQANQEIKNPKGT